MQKYFVYPTRSLIIVMSAILGVLGMNLPANAACTNPATIPAGFAAPCPVFEVSPTSVSQAGTLTLSATPQPGTDYIYTTAYISQGSNWNPYTLTGNNAAPSYSSSQASLTLSSAQLSVLSLGTHYAVVWDWLWDATAQCYKGPGLNQCNTGQWRVQSFTITATYTYSQSSYYAYSQSSYYAYSQSSYTSYTYSQSSYYAYSHGRRTTVLVFQQPRISYLRLEMACLAPWVLDIRSRNLASEVLAWVGAPLETGDKALDQAVVIQGDDEAAIRKWTTHAEVRSKILSLFQVCGITSLTTGTGSEGEPVRQVHYSRFRPRFFLPAHAAIMLNDLDGLAASLEAAGDRS